MRIFDQKIIEVPKKKINRKASSRKFLKIDGVIQIQRRSMSDPPLSDIDFKYKMAWV